MLLLMFGLAGASDHFDGSASTRHPARDLTDLYTWVPETDGQSRLAIVMALHPYATRRSEFSADLTYRFTIHPASIEGVGGDMAITTGASGTTIDCHLGKSETLTCRLEALGFPSRTRVVTTTIDDENGGVVEGIRLFAGLRRDPFFIDTRRVSDPRPRAGSRTSRGALDVTDNALVRSSVLAIALELDPEQVLGGDGLFSVSSQAIWAAYEPNLPRIGSPR